MSERRNKIVQWMLNQGCGIVDAPETCFLKETTEKEQAEHPFGSVRYVYSMVVNLFENEIPCCGSITIFPRMRFWNAMTGFLRNWTKQEKKPFRPLRKTWKHLH